ncbi:hypothetical protein CBM2634_U90005 [Cupriavidus taiwanensis]|uniref:Uncharacterized protein n=1 Tax=Cupriavidus taiwanensis TaxID=164546 RepID=A0A375JGG7_9BURK|nr:hypothetical protein CBM2634_U90005 [Cupriavidus taiwanensis]
MNPRARHGTAARVRSAGRLPGQCRAVAAALYAGHAWLPHLYRSDREIPAGAGRDGAGASLCRWRRHPRDRAAADAVAGVCGWRAAARCWRWSTSAATAGMWAWERTWTTTSWPDCGGYWYHQQRRQPHPAVHDTRFQERLLAALARATGTGLP